MNLPELPYQLLTTDERDCIVGAYLREHLLPLGLCPIGPRVWIDESRPPVKRMFELALTKGAGMKPQWGFSLDFVPHISGGRVRRHRTKRTARLDVIVDAREGVVPRLTSIFGAAQLHEDLKRVLPAAVKRAEDTWKRGVNERGLLDLVREIRERKTNLFGFRNYTQLPLAYAFLSAKLGDFVSAVQELEDYVARMELDDEAAAKLKQIAVEYSVNTAGLE